MTLFGSLKRFFGVRLNVWPTNEQSNSLVDIKRLTVFIDFIEGARVEVKNPLLTEFDSLEIRLPGKANNLASSCFFHSWTEEDELKFRCQIGVWVISTPDIVAFCFQKGSKASVPEHFARIEGADIGGAIFFAVPEEMAGKRKRAIDAGLICFN